VDDLAGPAPCGDADRLLQVASALVSNALAYTPAGGEIRVSAEAQGGRWTLLVDDSGPGIPESERDRVFDRFTRLDASRTPATGGFGLGLAICKRLAEAMGGSISAGDSPIGGARLVVDLPLDDLATGVSDGVGRP
jgi:signal transduction histidine kinase